MHRYLTIMLSVVLGAASFAQDSPNSSFSFTQNDTAKSSYEAEQESAHNSLLLFEDIFERFNNQMMLSQFYRYYKINHTSTGSRNYNYKYDYHYLSLSGGYGKRDKYSIGSSLNLSGDELTGPNSDRAFSINLKFRPGKTWQISNFFGTRYRDKSTIKDNFDWGGSLLYLSQGQINMAPNKFSHYFFFRDILVERKQLMISFIPSYSFYKNDYDYSSDLNKFASLPITFLYGLSNRINFKFNFRFNIQDNSNDYSIFSNEAAGNEKIGTMRYKQKEENIRSDIGLYMIPGSRFLLAGTAYFDHKMEKYRSSEHYFNGFNQFYKSVNKRDAYAIDLRANYLSVHREISIGDFRRSFYNGTYLKQTELKNQLFFSFYSREYDYSRKWNLGNNFDFGFSDNINVFLKGGYARIKNNYQFLNKNSSWYYSSGLIFYNLNFSGEELNDFDYFYGRIVQPKDYITTLRWQQSREYDDSKAILLDLQTGITRNVDVRLDFCYAKNSSQSASFNFGSGLRMNLLHNFRVLLGGWYGRSDRERNKNSYNYSKLNSYFWQLNISAQAAF